MRSKVNRRKDVLSDSKTLCYDEMEDIGHAFYLLIAPQHYAGAGQGLKTESAVKVQQGMQNSLTHKGPTTYMFLHWVKRQKKNLGNWRQHPFIRSE
jgi:hypothetical protein